MVRLKLECSILPFGSDFFQLAEARMPIQEGKGGRDVMSYEPWAFPIG